MKINHIRDITERKRTEQALLDAGHEFRRPALELEQAATKRTGALRETTDQ